MSLSHNVVLESTMDMVMGELDKLETYEDKHKFLTTGTVTSPRGKKVSIKKMVTYFPEVQEATNKYMLGTAISEMGNPEDPAYTFSKDISDLALRQSMERLYPEGQALGGDLKETRSQYEQEYLDEAGDWAPKNLELQERKENLKSSIKAQRTEFDKRATWFPGRIPVVPWWTKDPDAPEDAAPIDKYDFDPLGLWSPVGSHYTRKIGPAGFLADLTLGGIMPVAHLATQAVAGWTDWAKDEELKKLESRRFKWDPGVKDPYSGDWIVEPGYGVPDKLKATQDKLESVLMAIDKLGSLTPKAEKIKARNKAIDADLKVYSESILDDLIEDGYTTPLQVLDMLQSGSEQY